MIRHLHKALMLLFVLVLTSGCVKEDFGDCENVTIYFQYLADGETDVLYKYMSKVDLYVFDEDGHIMGVGNYNQDELTNFAAVPSFRLKPGKRYKVVAVGNAYDATEVVNLSATSFDDIFIQNPNWGNRSTRVVNHDDNYLGQLEFVMPDQEGVMYRDTVTLYSAHLDVDVEIHGLPSPDASAPSRQDASIPYELSIENSNAQCSFNNEVNTDDAEKGTIYPDLIYDYEKQCYRTNDFALFRMDDGHGHVSTDCCEHKLVLKNKGTGEVLVQGNIYNYVKSHEDQIDLTKQEAVLPIEIEFSSASVEIKLPDWMIVDGTPEWK